MSAGTDGPLSAGTDGPAPIDVRAALLEGARVLAHGSPAGGRAGTAGTTSDLSIDETLLVHAAGWEPVALVSGVSVASVPAGVWTWGQGEIRAASAAYRIAVTGAVDRLRDECARAGGHGVVGVSVEVEVDPHHVDVELTGTAVRPLHGPKEGPEPFVSDLSARDFTLLQSAGWVPVGLASGASFVYAPRRTAGTALRQSGQNVELTNVTEAMYAARESAMERMQHSALAMGGQGVVAVRVTEGPMAFARHAIGFTAWGTTVRLQGEAHRYVRPEVVLPLDDSTVQFEAGSLRGT